MFPGIGSLGCVICAPIAGGIECWPGMLGIAFIGIPLGPGRGGAPGPGPGAMTRSPWCEPGRDSRGKPPPTALCSTAWSSGDRPEGGSAAPGGPHRPCGGGLGGPGGPGGPVRPASLPLSWSHRDTSSAGGSPRRPRARTRGSREGGPSGCWRLGRSAGGPPAPPTESCGAEATMRGYSQPGSGGICPSSCPRAASACPGSAKSTSQTPGAPPR